MRLEGLRAVRFPRMPPLTTMISYSVNLYLERLGYLSAGTFDQDNKLYFFINDMHLVRLRAVRFVRTSSFITIIKSSAYVIQRLYYD